MEDLSTLSTETLMQYWANARVTLIEALGHGKAEHNERLCIQYGDELTKRHISVLDVNFLMNGEFNGPGSY